MKLTVKEPNKTHAHQNLPLDNIVRLIGLFLSAQEGNVTTKGVLIGGVEGKGAILIRFMGNGRFDISPPISSTVESLSNFPRLNQPMNRDTWFGLGVRFYLYLHAAKWSCFVLSVPPF